MSRVELFDRFGQKVTEFTANADRSWLMNDYGRCLFTMSTYDAKCIENYLQYGNYVYIEHEKLPAWGGVIDPPREWGRHQVEITAYSGEYIFSFRRAEGAQRINATPGVIFQRILSICNAEGDTRIREGEIYTQGKPVRWQLNVLKCYQEVKRLAEETNSEWTVRAKTRSGEIRFLADWSIKLGLTRNFLLKEGHNIKADDRVIIEDGQIANDVLGISPGASPISARNVFVKDEKSIGAYGLRQWAESFQQNEYGSVAEGANAVLQRMKEPVKTFRLSALDVGDTWKNLDIGDVLKLYMSNIGFNNGQLGTDTDVRINSMTFVEDENILELETVEQ